MRVHALFIQIGDLMKREIFIVLCFSISLFSNAIPSTFAESESQDNVIELTFDFVDIDTGQIIDSAEISVIEGWSGIILEQNTLFSGESIFVMANHSLRFKLINEGYNEWDSKSMIYSDSESIIVNFTSVAETYDFPIEEEVNVTGGNIELSFMDPMSSNNDINLSWSANYIFSMHLGTTLLPTKSLGLSGQIDYWLGNKDGTLQNSEVDLFVNWLQEQAWVDPYFGGCCKVDGNFPIVSDLVKPVNAWIDAELGIWGWNESATLSVHSGFTGTRLLEIPLQNDIRQLADMQITTHSEWEFRYSPNSNWIEGSPTKIHLNRSSSGISGFVPITFAKNTPPVVHSVVIGHVGLSLPLDVNITFDGSNSIDSSHNIGLGPNLECLWKFKSGNIIHDFLQMSVIVNFTELGFLSDESIETTLECTDPQGLTNLWNKSWYLDSTPPNAIELFGDAECIDKPLETNLLECEELLVESSKMLLFNLSLEDDGPSEPFVFWSSNHIDGWAAEGNEMDVAFWQGKNTNIHYAMYDQHHEQRELAIWEFNMRISDEVANDWIKSWNITVLDGSAPKIKMKFMNQYQILDPMNNIYFGDELMVDLNSSFDDINAIEDVRFVINLDGEVLADSNEIGWDGIKSVSLPILEVGIHEVSINATDSVGNTVEDFHQIHISPSPVINIISTEVVVPSGELIVGENELEFRLVNIGGSPYDAIICIQNKCLDSNGTGATISGFGYTNITLKFNLNESENLDVNYSLTFESQIIQFNETYEFNFKSENDQKSFFLNSIFLILVIILFLIFLNRGGYLQLFYEKISTKSETESKDNIKT